MKNTVLPFYRGNSFQTVRKHSVIHGNDFVALNSYGTVVALISKNDPQYKIMLHSSWNETSTTKKNVVSFLNGYFKYIWNEAVIVEWINKGIIAVSSDPLMSDDLDFAR